MGNNGGFRDEPTAPGTYSHLLFSDGVPGHAPDECLGFSSCFPSPDDNNRHSSQRVLHFGDYSSHSDVNVVAENAVDTGHISGVGLPHPGTVSPEQDCTLAALPKNKRKRVGSGPVPCQVKRKKSKSQISGHAKVGRKESLGERVTILQQLVSPFGKTDTASVLHEASCYIRFLHDQIQVLSSPYLPIVQDTVAEEENDEGERRKDDLRSRGLCLVPLELSLHVAEESNGADLWSSSAAVFGG